MGYLPPPLRGPDPGLRWNVLLIAAWVIGAPFVVVSVVAIAYAVAFR